MSAPGTDPARPRGLWRQAAHAAAHTPETRNRAVDLYRAVAIGMVILGHWFLIAPQIVAGEVRLTLILTAAPWTQYVTWLFQVMPVFFFVGGYANAISWRSAQADAAKRRDWAASRLSRLLTPTVPLVLVWAVTAVLAKWAGVPPELIDAASKAALVPVWFLAVYIVITVVVPAAGWVWERFGPSSVVLLFAGAIAVDSIAFGFDMGWLRWTNYGFIWLAVHQMGFWWESRRHATPPWALIAAVGVVWMVVLIAGLGFPVAMIGVPGEEISNTRPPTTAMIAIGCVHIGLLLGLAPIAKRWMLRVRAWAAVIVVNQMIMTVYLWHITAVIVLICLSLLAGGLGLERPPGEAGWWIMRPVWIGLLMVMLVPFVVLFRGFEAAGKAGTGRSPGYLWALSGALMACSGLVMLALRGIGAGHAPGFNPWAVILVVAGAWAASGVFPLRSRGRS